VISAVALAPGNILSVYLGAAGTIGYEALRGSIANAPPSNTFCWALAPWLASRLPGVMAAKAKNAVEQVADRSTGAGEGSDGH
jgi:hypothetical protein